VPPTPTDLLDIVAALHEGVIDDASWSTALDALSDHLGKSGLLLGTMPHTAPNTGPDTGPDTGNTFDLVGHRVDPAAIALLAGPLANPHDNPWVAAAPRLALRRPASVGDIGGQDLLEASRVWDGFYTGFGYDQAVGAVLERQCDYTDIMMLARGGDPYAGPELTMFQALIPHVARAFRVRRQVREWRKHADDLSAALDHLERGIIITGPEGQIRYTNRAAEQLLTTGDGIDATHGRVRATRTRDTAELRRMIHRSALTGIGQDQIAVNAVSIARSNAEQPIAVIAEPLAPGHHEGMGQGRREGAILFVGDSNANARLSAKRIAAIYDLTAAEADITASIVSGASVASAAEARGITENTAKTHLKSVYEKIGINRQNQLVRRVMADVGGLVNS
jgi:DNA-binding CsgD family transcriptional regulator